MHAAYTPGGSPCLFNACAPCAVLAARKRSAILWDPSKIATAGASMKGAGDADAEADSGGLKKESSHRESRSKRDEKKSSDKKGDEKKESKRDDGRKDDKKSAKDDAEKG